MKVTILGCGPSAGVPTVTGDWGVCDPNNPKNRRRRPSILVEQDDYAVLVDTSPDFREQAIDAGITHIDAVLWTHEHADHVMGIDDLRGIHRQMGRMIEAFAPPHVLDHLVKKFGYLFENSPDTVGNLYRPIYRPNMITGNFETGPFEITPIDQDHGICSSLGFRFGNFAYSTDVLKLPQESLDALHGLDCWIVDCLRPEDPHPTHAVMDEMLAWVEEVKPKRTVLTHMNFQSDYEELCALLPDGVEPGYDGMTLELADFRDKQ